MALHVLMATAYYESHRGGIEIVAGRLARELVAGGARVTWLATDAAPPPTAGDRRGDVAPVSAWNITERHLGVPFPLPGPAALATIWRRVADADVVLMHDSLYPTNVVAMLAARRHRRPVVLVQHIAAVPYRNPVLRFLMAAANVIVARPMLRAADQVVFISETVARHFAGLRLATPPRLVFNGVDTDLLVPPAPDADISDVRDALWLPADRPVVAFVGRFVEKKGLHVIERVARARPDVTFALAGWGPIDPRGWGLPNVHVRDDLAGPTLVPLYQASDVLLLPSIGEGLPLVVQEALACGLPVICGAETADADAAAREHLCGVAIDPADPDGTAARCLAVLDDVLAAAAGPTTPGAAARAAFVRARYSWAEAARTYAAIMGDLVTARHVTAAPPAPVRSP
jgi:glycosyltransferase involved in cell wall biosynthesis